MLEIQPYEPHVLGISSPPVSLIRVIKRLICVAYGYLIYN